MNPWISVADRMPEKLTRVIVAFRTTRGRRGTTTAEYIPEETVLFSEYMNPDYCGDLVGDYDEETEDYYAPEGWYENEVCGEVNWYMAFAESGNYRITHWMPLPQFPESTEEAPT